MSWVLCGYNKIYTVRLIRGFVTLLASTVNLLTFSILFSSEWYLEVRERYEKGPALIHCFFSVHDHSKPFTYTSHIHPIHSFSYICDRYYPTRSVSNSSFGYSCRHRLEFCMLSMDIWIIGYTGLDWTDSPLTSEWAAPAALLSCNIFKKSHFDESGSCMYTRRNLLTTSYVANALLFISQTDGSRRCVILLQQHHLHTFCHSVIARNT